jgi:hypothetical protein
MKKKLLNEKRNVIQGGYFSTYPFDSRKALKGAAVKSRFRAFRFSGVDVKNEWRRRR